MNAGLLPPATGLDLNAISVDGGGLNPAKCRVYNAIPYTGVT